MEKITWVGLYPNKHVLDTAYDMESNFDCDIDYYFFKGIPKERDNQGWVVPERYTIIPSLLSGEYFKCLWRVLRAEQCILFGSVDPFPWMFIIFVCRVNFSKKTYFISEGLRYRTSHLKKCLSSLLMNRKGVTYLAIGDRAADDFRKLGMSKWQVRRYAFAEKYKEVKAFERPVRDEVNILAVGRLIERKNFASVIHALANYDGDRRVTFKVAGQGEEREMLLKLAKSVLPHNVELQLLGLCDSERLDVEFREADLFVISSLYDGWGAVVNQALAYGLPIIASKETRSAPNNLVIHGTNGYVYGNQMEMVSQLIELIDNSNLREEMSKEAFKMAPFWSVDEIARRTKQVISSKDEIDYDTGVLKKI